MPQRETKAHCHVYKTSIRIVGAVMAFRVAPPMESFDRWRCLRLACALGTGCTYGFTYLLVSWCLATGVFHPSTDTSPASHHHAGAHPHDHHHETSSDPSWLDICRFALQILLTSVWLYEPPTVAAWAPSEALRGLDDDVICLQIPADLCIRSPPLLIAA
jgi:hypothetical protein